MVGRPFSITLTGIAGATAVSLLIPVLLAINLDKISLLPDQIERAWLLAVIPVTLFLTGAAAAYTARKHIRGLVDCSQVSGPAGAIAILPAIPLYLGHYAPSPEAWLVVVYLIVMLLAAVAGGFACFYFLHIQAKSL